MVISSYINNENHLIIYREKRKELEHINMNVEKKGCFRYTEK